MLRRSLFQVKRSSIVPQQYAALGHQGRSYVSHQSQKKTSHTTEQQKQQGASASHPHYTNVGEMSGSCADRDGEGSMAGYGSNSMDGNSSGWKTGSQLHREQQEKQQQQQQQSQKEQAASSERIREKQK